LILEKEKVGTPTVLPNPRLGASQTCCLHGLLRTNALNSEIRKEM